MAGRARTIPASHSRPVSRRQDNAKALTKTRSQAIAVAEQEIVTTREQLRQVEFDLDRNISRLENELRLFCVVLVPALLALVAIGLGLLRRRGGGGDEGLDALELVEHERAVVVHGGLRLRLALLLVAWTISALPHGANLRSVPVEAPSGCGSGLIGLLPAT